MRRIADARLGARLMMALWLCALLVSCSFVEDVPPIADAGRDQTVKLGAAVTLDASKSREIDGGKIVEYRWIIIGVPKGNEGELNRVLTTTTQPTIQVQLPSDEVAVGVWTLELRVTDNGGNRAANEVRVTVTK